MTQQEFSNRLTELRLQKNVSSREMSLFLGRAQSYINNIECGLSFPSFACFFEICDYLGVSPQEFFDTDMHDPHTFRELTEVFKTLPPEELAHLLAIAKSLHRK